MRVRELMTGGLITVRRETSVQGARDLMTREQIRHLPVLDPGGALVGVVTDRDIRLNLPSPATGLSEQEIGYLLDRLTVGQSLTQSVIMVGPDRQGREAAQLMLEHRIGAVPVVDDGRLIGILTETDIVRAFIRVTAPLRGVHR